MKKLFLIAGASALFGTLIGKILSAHRSREEKIRRMLRRAIFAGIATALLSFIIAFYLVFSGPRMDKQMNIRSYQAPIYYMAEGTIPVEAVSPSALSGDMADLKNPLPQNHEVVKAGKVYYQYYCVFCHNDNGDGNGPVGQSYTPKPADLRDNKIQFYTDGQLLYAMLKGRGHEPVLERIIPENHRWYILSYLRSLK
jgi:hypothetical protein